MVILMLNRKKLLEKTHLKSFSQIRFSVQKDNTKGYLTRRLKEFFDQGQTTITLKKLFFTQNVVYQIGFMFLIPFRNVPNQGMFFSCVNFKIPTSIYFNLVQSTSTILTKFNLSHKKNSTHFNPLQAISNYFDSLHPLTHPNLPTKRTCP